MIEDGRLRELRTEHEGSEVVVGDIYQGRVTDVLPGIQSAFVDIGAGENAYLYVDDVPPPRASQASAQSKPGISERVQVGQRLLVQVS
ncbi:Rne/Rng family ribonuclease, partial [Stenotrophomonas maltophilia]|nr:Rne/Rng family ribonuclease [Stenotrophomonas maltophilia]